MNLTDAWRSYEALLKKKKRSAGTIADYRDKYERHLKQFHTTALRTISRTDVVANRMRVRAAQAFNLLILFAAVIAAAWILQH
jgi:two-component sensor histidine kinase